MKIVLQDGIKDCGICSLLSVIRFYGGDVSKEYLRELTNTTKSGVSAYKIIECAEKIGFKGYGVRGDLKNIDKNNLPCLAHLIINKSYQHFVVIYDVDFSNNKVLIMDPAKGRRILSFSEFRLLSSNNFIYLKPIKKLPVVSYKKVIIDSIKEFSKHNKFMIFLIILLSSLYFILNVIVAFHFKYLLEFVINYRISSNVLFISCYLFIVYSVKEITFFLRNLLLLKWISMFDSEITISTYKRLLLLPYLYYKNRTTGEVVSRIKDLTIIKNFLAKFICSLTTDLFTVVIFIIFMFNISCQLTCYVLVIISIIFIYNIIISKYKKRVINKYHRCEEKINSYLIESLASVESLKGLHIENDFVARFKMKYKRYLESYYRMSFLFEINNFFKNNINNLLLIIIYGIGVFFVVLDRLNVAELFIYQGILSYFLGALNNLIYLQAEVHSFKAAINRIHDMFTIKQEVFDGGMYYNLYDLCGDIEYNNLAYSYNHTFLFNELNFTIKRGSKVLITGSSGAGKSTLMKMLMRYIEVPFDQIKINGIDINHYHLEVLRNKITYVTGNEFLFSNTIYNNIVLNREIDRDKVLTISKLVLVDEVVEKDNLKYQKLVEENGFNFSGGERQRIILARTLLKDSDIYIFDEALSQIDIEREEKILKNIFRYLKNKTIIVISHRFNNQNLFDQVIKLEGGKIYEVGKV